MRRILILLQLVFDPSMPTLSKLKGPSDCFTCKPCAFSVSMLLQKGLEIRPVRNPKLTQFLQIFFWFICRATGTNYVRNRSKTFSWITTCLYELKFLTLSFGIILLLFWRYNISFSSYKQPIRFSNVYNENVIYLLFEVFFTR